MSMFPVRSRKGLSVPELVIGIGIFSILLLVVITAYFTYTNVFRVQTARGDLQRTALRALTRVVDTVRSSSAVVASRTIDGTAYTTDADTLVLDLPAVGADGQFIPNAYDAVAFDRHPTDSTRYIEVTGAAAGSSRVTGSTFLTDMVVRVSFEYNNADVTRVNEVTMVVALTTTVRSQTVTATMDAHARLRNK